MTAVYVTHDQEEAMTIADRVAVFMEGRLVQTGTPKDIFMKPATVAVAGFIGTPPMNLLDATVSGGQVHVNGNPVAPAAVREGEVVLGVRPGDLRLAPAGLPARVDFVEDLGDSLVVHLEDDAADANATGAGTLMLFVVLRDPGTNIDTLRSTIATELRTKLSPRHVPDELHIVPALPRTLSGKKLEVPVKKILQGMPVEQAATKGALADPSALDVFSEFVR